MLELIEMDNGDDDNSDSNDVDVDSDDDDDDNDDNDNDDEPDPVLLLIIIITIIHWTHYLFSDWPKAYCEFSKSAPGTSSSCRLYNNHVKDTQGHG